MGVERAQSVGKGCLIAAGVFGGLVFGLVVAAGVWVLVVLLQRIAQAVLMHWSWWPLPIVICGSWFLLAAAGTLLVVLRQRRKRTWLVSRAPGAIRTR